LEEKFETMGETDWGGESDFISAMGTIGDSRFTLFVRKIGKFGNRRVRFCSESAFVGSHH
jgi:hypothetical protein